MARQGQGPGSRAYRPQGGGPAGRPRAERSKASSCCPMVAAVRSVKRGKLRLARRYALMSLRLLAGA